ncbi:hypothetical protein PBY51_014958 [Eleginops maclovinus]|uniref:Uncharacterized protein n=1 Tax=Eleginops maclovinus TaxID=56733 RepID=A0AAN7X5R8_ELEMC|nr:hypothetical protein PBY51_014958 [Eleginops maclovinus]
MSHKQYFKNDNKLISQLTSARHDISPNQDEKNQRTETLVTLHPNREHLFRLRRSGASQGFPRSVTKLLLSNKVP